MREVKYAWSLMLTTLIALSMLTISGCGNDDDDDPGGGGTPTPPNPNREINNWIYDNMDVYYLWTDQIPSNPNRTQDPEDFFDDLLSSEDRFSYIVDDYQDLINSLNGVSLEAGYEFVLFRESADNENVIALILYVKHNSPAEDAGLMRGDIITQINGTTMDLDNYQFLLGNIDSDHDVSYERFVNESSAYVDQGSVSLTAIELADNPNHVAQVLDFGGQKVGYFMYTFFSPGTGQAYDNEMDQIFADFKAQGVTNFVLDLRYNGGGSVSSARNLASLIAPGVTGTNIFYENRWNDELQAYIESLEDGDDILRGKFLEKAENIGQSLAGQTVYVLVGSRTASASELMINGLLPYMDVVIIGEETIGKNVGSIPIEDDENDDNDYGMLPIVFRTYNSDGLSNYADGFSPAGDNLVEEFMQLPLEPLGDPSEPLLARALELMGISTPGRVGGRVLAPYELPVRGEAIKFSLDDKPGVNTMYLPQETLPEVIRD